MMIDFEYKTEFRLEDEPIYMDWLNRVVGSLEAEIQEVTYIFCNDVYLHSLNVQYLKHDTYTDILTFDRTVYGVLAGDVFISVDRVRENATVMCESFTRELQRVMVHGLLHMHGMDDSTEREKGLMRALEDEKIKMFHVEQA